MKISVIIPAHNEESRIRTALESIRSQDCGDFEVIVVDNASSDRTAEIARSFMRSFPRLKVVSEEHPGTMWACERGRREATGDVIVRMDADCEPGPDWLSRGVRHFADPKVVLVSGPYHYHDWNIMKNPLPFDVSLVVQKIIYTSVNWLLQALKLGALSLGGNTFLRATTLAQMGGFNTAIRFYGDDTDTAKRASKFGRVVFDARLVVKTAAPTSRRHGGKKKIVRYWWHFFKVIFSK